MLRLIFAAWILTAAVLAAQTVEGLVVNSATGIGIPDVAVNLRQAGKNGYSATTDSQGHFRMENVKEGAYTANYKADHFWPVPNSLNGGGPQPPFQVTAGREPVRLNAKMQPVGTISGRVLDGGGKPVPNAGLWQHWQSSNAAITHVSKTDAKGEYNLDNFEVPGPWMLSAVAPESWPSPDAQDGQRFAWAQTFYPGVTDSQLAARVIVPPASELRLDIKLAAAPVHRVRGVVLDARSNPAPKTSVTLARDLDLPALHQTADQEGVFEFPSVTDDEWGLSANATWDGVKQWGGQRIQLKGHDLENVELRLAPPFDIRGKVAMEAPEGVSTPKPPAVLLMFYGATLTDPVLINAPIHSNFGADLYAPPPNHGSDFTFENLYPGRYRIIADSPPANYYLDSIRLGDRDALESGVQILSGAQALTVTYKLNGGSVRGTVESCGGGQVLLIPQDPALRRDGFVHRIACDQNGRFAIPAVRPGEYYGVAIAADSPTAGPPAEFDQSLINQSTRVTVRSNEATAAELRLIRR